MIYERRNEITEITSSRHLKTFALMEHAYHQNFVTGEDLEICKNMLDLIYEKVDSDSKEIKESEQKYINLQKKIILEQYPNIAIEYKNDSVVGIPFIVLPE